MGAWEASIYINGKFQNFIKIKGNPPLDEIRELCKNIIPKDDNYYFISNKNKIIKSEKNFDVKDAYIEVKENQKKVYNIYLETILFREGNYIEIYINNEYKKTLKIKSSKKLKDIRNLCEDIIPKDENYYFISKYKSIINTEENDCDETDILKKDGDKYRIDLKTLECHEDKPLLINIYINGKNDPLAVSIGRDSKLSNIKNKLPDYLNKDKIFFMTKDKSLILSRIDDFKLENIIFKENNEKKIYMYGLIPFKRMKVIEDLKKLEKKEKSINWFEQTDFFFNVKELVNEQMAVDLKNEILGVFEKENGNNETPGNNNNETSEDSRKRNDNQFIKKYLDLLLEVKDNDSPAPLYNN